MVENKPRRRRGKKGAANAKPPSASPPNKSNKINNKNSKQALSSKKSFNSSSSFSSSVLIHNLDGEWYNYQVPGCNDTILNNNKDSKEILNENLKHVEKFRSMADDIYQGEIFKFKKQLQNSGDDNGNKDEQWLENTMRRGTLKDRIAAISVTITTDPIHKFYAIDGLLQMVGATTSNTTSTYKSSQTTGTNSRVAQLASEALEDLFSNTFLPKKRKLYTLEQRPLYLYASDKQKTISPRLLLLWRFEEMVKEKYHAYIHQYISKTLQHAGEEQQKIATVRTAANLLANNPENEASLLSMVVNKLGDPQKKVASAAGHQLRMILQQHPAMQSVIAREVQQLAHRPKLSSKGLYNCIIFLNQLQLRRNDPLPPLLIKTYFRLFEVSITKHDNKKDKASKDYMEQEGGMQSRLLSALLAGVNRAHPYLPDKDKDMEEYVDALYKVAHTAAPAACTQALLLLFHVTVGSTDYKGDNETDEQYDIVTDEDYMTDDKKKQQQDKSNNKVDDDSNKILLQQRRQDRFYRALYATLSNPINPIITNGGKHLTMFFNLLYKAMKYDTDINRVITFAKRIMCTTLHCPPPIISGSLFLLNEVAKTHSELQTCLQEKPEINSNLLLMNENSDDDGDDNDIDDNNNIENNPSMLILDPTKREPRSALVMCTTDSDDKDGANKNHQPAVKKDDTELVIQPPSWELSMTLFHFHPSVSKFSAEMGQILFEGDPLKDFSLGPFLDKFAYRNPKKSTTTTTRRRGESIAECRHQVAKSSSMMVPVNDPDFIANANKNKIKMSSAAMEQDEFFIKYFTERAKRDELKGIVRGKSTTESKKKIDNTDNEDGEVNDIDDAEFDEAIDQAERAEGFEGGFSETFEDYEKGWTEDPEEDEFADSLALKLIEDTAAGRTDEYEGAAADNDKDSEGWEDDNGDNMEGGLPVDLDDEDPDMEGWDDLRDEKYKMYEELEDDDDDEDEDESDDGDDSGESKNDDDDDDDDDDEEEEDKAMMEFFGGEGDDDDDEEEDDAEEKISKIQKINKEKDNDSSNDDGPMDDQDAFMDASSDEDKNDDDDDDDDGPMFLGIDDANDSDGNNDGELGGETIFASAEDYEERINAQWNKRKSSAASTKVQDNDATPKKEKSTTKEIAKKVKEIAFGQNENLQKK